MMKKKKAKLFLSCFLICALFVGASFCCFDSFSQNVAYAETFSGETISADNFSMTMKAQSRSSKITLQREEQSALPFGASADTDDEVTYLVFQWSQLERLQFVFSTGDLGSTSYSYSFSVSYLRAETLNPSMSAADETTTLSTSRITSSSSFNFYYYIDSDSSATLGTNTARGNDFGLYKFNFSYSYTQNSQTITKCVGEIFVAVLPDDVEEIDFSSGLQVTYTVSSSNKLMNVFNLSVLGSEFAYCNPDRFVWQVEGVDQNGYNYCLDQNMQQLLEYQFYLTIWDSDVDNMGTSFLFDSNDIEGTWAVTLNILDSEGEAFQTCTVENLSTVKSEKVSYVWLIIGVIVGVILIVGVVLLVILLVHKRKEKVW